MKIAYKTDDAVLANLICGMLNSEGIAAQVNGEYLTGALGELPFMGVVTVVVDDDNQVAAMDIVAEFNSGARSLPGALLADEEDKTADSDADGQLPAAG